MLALFFSFSNPKCCFVYSYIFVYITNLYRFGLRNASFPSNTKKLYKKDDTSASHRMMIRPLGTCIHLGNFSVITKFCLYYVIDKFTMLDRDNVVELSFFLSKQQHQQQQQQQQSQPADATKTDASKFRNLISTQTVRDTIVFNLYTESLILGR